MPTSISRDLMTNVRGDVDEWRGRTKGWRWKEGGDPIAIKSSHDPLPHMIDVWQIDIKRR